MEKIIEDSEDYRCLANLDNMSQDAITNTSIPFLYRVE